MPLWVTITVAVLLIIFLIIGTVFGERTFKDKADVYYGNDVKDWNKDSTRNKGRTKNEDYRD